jgi:predicted GIY-YIG superfamily endonuclease
MNRYQAKLEEISKARNCSLTAAKIRGVKFTKLQLQQINLLAAEKVCPTLDVLRKKFKKMGNFKLETMLKNIKKKRKELAIVIGNDDIDGIRNSDGNGFIYLIENEMYSGWIKCGMTTNLSKRLNSYNTNDPLRRFQFVIHKEVDSRRKAEKHLMLELSNRSDLINGEWFRIEKKMAIDIFSKCI